jgi:hypothetical protein
MNIHRETLLRALHKAIRIQEKEELKLGYDRGSGQLMSWKIIFNKLQEGENIYFKQSDYEFAFTRFKLDQLENSLYSIFDKEK